MLVCSRTWLAAFFVRAPTYEYTLIPPHQGINILALTVTLLGQCKGTLLNKKALNLINSSGTHP